MSGSVVGLIGTAGRGDDADKLKLGHWYLMCAVAQTVAVLTNAHRVVSGGSAWSDHTAIYLWLNRMVPELSLHLPCDFRSDTKAFAGAYGPSQCADSLNRYHTAFSRVLGHSSLADIALCGETKIADPGRALDLTFATLVEQRNGYQAFFARNAKVAAEATTMLAFTFGEKGQSGLKDGGTKHTMDLFLKRRTESVSSLAAIGTLNPEETSALYSSPLPAYHFNLTDKVLYRL